ncbi:MAG: hypothetical protein JRC91_01130 [Deltaproteobacteria bacterium]|nr:hypothetical protein [Deltaproteobacteria bacterium]
MTDTTDWDDDILSEDETDDDIIDLTDIITENSVAATQEDIIELEDETSSNEDFEFESNDLIEDPIDNPADDPADDLMDDISIEQDQEIVSPQELSLPPEQLEAALERVIEKKFGDKIETLLFEVMEKVIEKEIAKIKESFQKELDR